MIVIIFNLFLISIAKITEDDKIPEYLSIETDSNISQRLIYDFMKKSLSDVFHKFDDIRVYSDYVDIFAGLNHTFHNPNSWHTTCLYIGDDLSKLESKIYKNFQENEKINIEISTFIYIPGKIMLSPVFFDNFNLIENKFPHVTLMVGEGYSAVDSNYVMSAIFNNFKDLTDLYYGGKIKDPNFIYEKKLTHVKIFDKEGNERIADTIYIIKSGNIKELDGFTKKNYKN